MPGEMDTVERAAAAQDNTFVTPDLAKNKSKDAVAIAHNDRAAWENREPYGPAGMLYSTPDNVNSILM